MLAGLPTTTILTSEAGARVQRPARVGEDRGVGSQQVGAFHALRPGLGTDQQGDVDAVEGAHGVVVDLDVAEQVEGAVDEFHHHALGGSHGRRQLKQAQRHRYVAAEQGARADPEQRGVADLARRAGDGDDLRAHVCTRRFSTSEAYRRTVSSAIAAASWWPGRALLCMYADFGSSVISASSSPVDGSHTAHVYRVSAAHPSSASST